MQINRNNYEHFFLLYADGELRKDECEAVEAFVAENEDLKVELEMLLATVLPPDEISFADKSFLYRETIFDIEIQEKLLLKIDNELPENELLELEKLISSNANVAKECNLLQATKLDKTEKVIFEEKYLLYKKESDNVIVFRILRLAAAAIFIGFGLFMGLKYFSKPNTSNNIELATKKDKSIKIKNVTASINEDSIHSNDLATKNTKIIKTNVGATEKGKTNRGENTISTNTTETTIYKNVFTKTNVAVKQNNKVEQIIPNEQQQVAVLNRENTLQTTQQIISKDVIQQTTILTATEKIKTLAVTNDNVVPLEDTYAKTLDLSTTEKSDNKILYMDEDDVKRSKAGGFFRKVKRFVARTANIKPGTTLQIAGFEIASK